MAKCEECNNSWGFASKVKRTMTIQAGMPCPHCGEKQYIKHEWKRLFIPIIIMSLLPILLFTTDISLRIFLLLFSILALISFLYMVFSIKLTSVEEGKQY